MHMISLPRACEISALTLLPQAAHVISADYVKKSKGGSRLLAGCFPDQRVE